jgi:hypothetical protein
VTDADVDIVLNSNGWRRGDVDLNGVVDAADLNTLGINWYQEGKGWADGDFNGDGIVNASDLNDLGISFTRSNSDAQSKVNRNTRSINTSLTEAGSEEDVEVIREQIGKGHVCFRVASPDISPEERALAIDFEFCRWLKTNNATIRDTLPIVTDGCTAVLHVWFDG